MSQEQENRSAGAGIRVVLGRLLPATLQGQMLILVSLVVLGTLFVSGAIFATFIADISKKQISRRALDIGHAVARMPVVGEVLEQGKDPDGRLQVLAEGVRKETRAQFVVIAGRDSKRFSHPDPEKIGRRFVGGDETRALEQGAAYVSEAVGTLGPSLRSIVPVSGPGGNVVGFVSVGYLQARVMETVKGYQREPATLVFMLFVVVLLGATGIARYVKKQTLGLEPREISSLYQDRQAVFDSIQSGIIAVGEKGEIRLMNQAAIELCGLDSGPPPLGEMVDRVFEGSDFRFLLRSERKESLRQVSVDGQTLLFTSVPIEYAGAVHGVVASFRPMEDFHRLREELRQTRQFSDMLRGQAHEYSNKLHTLAGLLQMEAYGEALELVTRESTGIQQMIQFLGEAVPHPALAAIIMGKVNRALEMKVDFHVNPDSTMGQIPGDLDQDKLISILGNLLDNGLEAAKRETSRPARVALFMTDIGHDLIFEIEDSGPGIDPADHDRIFSREVSSKPSGHGKSQFHGMGLFLVDRYVRDLGGQLTISTGDLGGALFMLSIPKKTEKTVHPERKKKS